MFEAVGVGVCDIRLIEAAGWAAFFVGLIICSRRRIS